MENPFGLATFFLDKRGFLIPCRTDAESQRFLASKTNLALGQGHATRRWQLLLFIETQFFNYNVYLTYVSYAGKYLIINSGEAMVYWFHGVNTLIVADFKLPIHLWRRSCEERRSMWSVPVWASSSAPLLITSILDSHHHPYPNLLTSVC